MAIPFVQRVFPALRILDAGQAREFYVERLGFRLDWQWPRQPGLPVFMQVSRDGLALYLSERDEDGRVGGLVYLYVDGVDEWYAELRRAGVEVDQAPQDQPWGNREMRLHDPFGNRLCIASVLTPRPAQTVG